MFEVHHLAHEAVGSVARDLKVVSDVVGREIARCARFALSRHSLVLRA